MTEKRKFSRSIKLCAELTPDEGFKCSISKSAALGEDELLKHMHLLWVIVTAAIMCWTLERDTSSERIQQIFRAGLKTAYSIAQEEKHQRIPDTRKEK